MTSGASLCVMPPEILRLIAHNLDFTYLISFQKASAKVKAATTDVSFYARYFEENHKDKALIQASSYRQHIIKWKEVAERLLGNGYELARFFITTDDRRFSSRQFNNLVLTGSNVECRYNEMGRAFAELDQELYQNNEANTIATIHDRISKIRRENMNLVNLPQWHCFEDILYSEFRYYLKHSDYEIKNLQDVKVWLQLMDFAKDKNYTRFQQKIMTKIIVSIVQNIAVGSIDYEDGIEHLKHLIPQLKETEDTGLSGHFIYHRPIESFKTMSKVSNFLTREIVGKRRSNYCGFFKLFVKNLVHSLSITVPYTNELEEKLDFLKG